MQRPEDLFALSRVRLLVVVRIEATIKSMLSVLRLSLAGRAPQGRDPTLAIARIAKKQDRTSIRFAISNFVVVNFLKR